MLLSLSLNPTSAQYLDRNAVEEWRKAYINYKGLKKLIKRVEEHHRQRLLILASLDSSGSDRLSLGPPRAKTNKKQQLESITELRERVKAAQTGLSGGYGSTGRSEDLAASPPPPHDLRPVLLDGTGLKISQAVKDRLSAGRKGGNTRTNGGATGVDDAAEGEDVESGRARGGDGSDPPSEGLDGRMPERDIVEQEAEESPDLATTGGQEVPLSKAKPAKTDAASGKKSKKHKKQAPKGIDEYLSHFFDPAEKTFFLALDSELERIGDFYEDRLAEAQVKFDELIFQLRELAEHRRRFKEAGDQAAILDRTRWAQSIPFVNEGINSPLPFGKSKKVVASPQAETKPRRFDTNRRGGTDSHATAVADRGASSSMDDEGAKRRSKALDRMERLAATEGAEGTDQQGERPSMSPDARQHQRHHGNRDHTLDPERYKAARHKLKEAMAEFYRGLELIRSYKVLNKDGFGKILKKFDKTLETSSSIPYFRSKIEPSILVQSQRIEALLKSTEDAFTGFFEHGDRKRALDRLRMQGTAKNGLHTHHASASRTGFFLGVSVCATVAGLVQMMQPETQASIPAWSALVRVYGALFLPILFAVLFGLNLAAFAYGRINTAFIFEWDARTSLDYHQYFEMPSFLLLLLALAFWVSFLNPFPTVISPHTWPLVWLVIVFVFLLNPLPVFRPRSRMWFNLSLLRVLGAGFLVKGGVEFRDFFLGDELNSIAWSVSSLWFIGCEVQRDWELPECDANGTYWTAFLLCVPALLRFGQCIRRWRDSGFSTRIHVLNAAKYASAVPHYYLYINWRRSGSGIDSALAAWVPFACIYSSFSGTWDILMDWSFFHPNARYPLLRNELVFEEVWPMYYFAIVSDIVLRFTWIIYILPGPASSLLRSFLVALLEVLRRFQWNFYRVGNEHQGNVDQYRALRDTPLPYHIPKGSSEDEEEPQETGFSVKLQKWRRKWTHSDHFDFQRHSTAGDGLEVDPPREDDAGLYRTHSGIAAATAAVLDPLHAFSREESREDSVVGRIQAFLVPDRGGYAARGPRLDEQSAAKGAMGRDYAPRAQEADADSDDAYTDDEYDGEGDGDGDGGDGASVASLRSNEGEGGNSGTASGLGSSSKKPQAIPAGAVTSTAKDRDDAAARSLSKSWDKRK